MGGEDGAAVGSAERKRYPCAREKRHRQDANYTDEGHPVLIYFPRQSGIFPYRVWDWLHSCPADDDGMVSDIYKFPNTDLSNFELPVPII